MDQLELIFSICITIASVGVSFGILRNTAMNNKSDISHLENKIGGIELNKRDIENLKNTVSANEQKMGKLETLIQKIEVSLGKILTKLEQK